MAVGAKVAGRKPLLQELQVLQLHTPINEPRSYQRIMAGDGASLDLCVCLV